MKFLWWIEPKLDWYGKTLCRQKLNCGSYQRERINGVVYYS